MLYAKGEAVYNKAVAKLGALGDEVLISRVDEWDVYPELTGLLTDSDRNLKEKLLNAELSDEKADPTWTPLNEYVGIINFFLSRNIDMDDIARFLGQIFRTQPFSHLKDVGVAEEQKDKEGEWIVLEVIAKAIGLKEDTDKQPEERVGEERDPTGKCWKAEKF